MGLNDTLLSVPDAAEFTGRHVDTIRRWINERGLKATKIPGRGRHGYEFRIKESDLMEFLKKEAV